MHTIEIKSEIKVFNIPQELPYHLQNLLDAAHFAATKAYAPYSQFKVGAAVLLQNGTVVWGNNQENAAYPSGLCAERVALFALGANYGGQVIQSIAIVAQTDKFVLAQPVVPCGACLQVMSEYERKQQQSIEILLGGAIDNHTWLLHGTKQLLPLQFDLAL
jgi:cytidine deaminase